MEPNLNNDPDCVNCGRPATTVYLGEGSCGAVKCELTIQIAYDYMEDHRG